MLVATLPPKLRLEVKRGLVRVEGLEKPIEREVPSASLYDILAALERAGVRDLITAAGYPLDGVTLNSPLLSFIRIPFECALEVVTRNGATTLSLERDGVKSEVRSLRDAMRLLKP